jgi:hypothetical protein
MSMQEGWLGDDYLILFAESEIADASARYEMDRLLPGYRLLGLRDWDDFIVQDSQKNTYVTPTVPVTLEYLTKFDLPVVADHLKADERFLGKVKWYTKPIAFGGDRNISGNLTWITHEEHAQLVKWWNKLYRQTRSES